MGAADRSGGAEAGGRDPSVSYELLSRYRGMLMGVEIVLIMAFHYSEDLSALHGDSFDGPWQVVYRYVGSSGVDMFLVLSGLGLYYSWRRTPDAGTFYRRRLARVCVPYAIVAVPAWIWLDLVHGGESIVRFVSDLTFVTFFTADVKWFWYVLVSLICYALFPMVFRVVDGAPDAVSCRLRTLLMCVVCLQLIMMLDQYDPGLYDNIDIAVNRVPSFMVGCCLGRMAYERRVMSRGRVAASLLVVMVLLYPLQMATTPVLQVLLRAMLNLLTCMVMVMAMDRMSCRGGSARVVHDAVVRVFSLAGRYSLELYLLHVCVRKTLNVTGHDVADVRYEFVVIAAAIAMAWPLRWVAALLQRRMIGVRAAGA